MHVSQHYKWDPENHHNVNFGIAKDLLGDHGMFLRNGIDEEVSHVYTCPCLSQLCLGTYQQPGTPCTVRSYHRFLLHRHLVGGTVVSRSFQQ